MNDLLLFMLRDSLDCCSSSPESCSYLFGFLSRPLGLDIGCTSIFYGLTSPADSETPQQPNLQALTKQRRRSMSRTTPITKKSISYLETYSLAYLKRQYKAMKIASPKMKMTLSMTGYLKTPFHMQMNPYSSSGIMMKWQQYVSLQQLLNPSSTLTDNARRQLKNYNHFSHMGVSSSWMHLQPISCRKGNRARKPRMAAAQMSLVVDCSCRIWVSSYLVAGTAMGMQTHLMKPLNIRYSGQYRKCGRQHFCTITTSQKKISTPARQLANDNWKPRLHTRSPAEQKVRKLQLKLARLVPSCPENEPPPMTNAKQQAICMNSSPRKVWRKKKVTGATADSPTIEYTRAAAVQEGTMLMLPIINYIQSDHPHYPYYQQQSKKGTNCGEQQSQVGQGNT